MDEREIRLRCIEAAAKTPMVHTAGQAAGVLEVAKQWAAWALAGDPIPGDPAAGVKMVL